LVEETKEPRENQRTATSGGRRDRMVVGFTTIYAISIYQH